MLRVLAALLLYWDSDNDGDVDAGDLVDWDGDGAADLLGTLSLVVKVVLLAALCNGLRRALNDARRRRRRVRELLVFASRRRRCSPSGVRRTRAAIP